MSASALPTGFEGYSKLADSVYIYQSTRDPSNTTSTMPSLIVLCAWMNASSKHVAKYTSGYKKLYPKASILVIQSRLEDVFASDKLQAPRLKVACDIVSSHKKSENAGSVVLHAMSNGGGVAAARMGQIFHDRGQTRVFDKLVLDCLPGIYDLRQITTAVSMNHLPKSPVLRFLVWWYVYFRIGFFSFLGSLIGREEDISKLRRRLNDPKLFYTGAARLYMYSKNDALIHHWAVREHAMEATKRGYRTQEVVYEKANHCALLMDGPEKYFNAIKDFVEEQ
ncbi:Hypothetical predicted protein [Lecanosticta acicola]|uniref:Indole-diterpene biosynthesis protein PaxU n=1 Tax=Lecanosticta acicola TaxID=111012 RepID=A0AAI9E702_9PEZI|nr:Hypothetical predicted protein [Lecanosticta acicola]